MPIFKKISTDRHLVNESNWQENSDLNIIELSYLQGEVMSTKHKRKSVPLKNRNQGLFRAIGCNEWNVCPVNFFPKKVHRKKENPFLPSPTAAADFFGWIKFFSWNGFSNDFVVLTKIVKNWNDSNSNNNWKDWFTSLRSLLNKHCQCQQMDNDWTSALVWSLLFFSNLVRKVCWRMKWPKS